MTEYETSKRSHQSWLAQILGKIQILSSMRTKAAITPVLLIAFTKWMVYPIVVFIMGVIFTLQVGKAFPEFFVEEIICEIPIVSVDTMTACENFAAERANDDSMKLQVETLEAGLYELRTLVDNARPEEALRLISRLEAQVADLQRRVEESTEEKNELRRRVIELEGALERSRLELTLHENRPPTYAGAAPQVAFPSQDHRQRIGDPELVAGSPTSPSQAATPYSGADRHRNPVFISPEAFTPPLGDLAQRGEIGVMHTRLARTPSAAVIEDALSALNADDVALGVRDPSDRAKEIFERIGSIVDGLEFTVPPSAEAPTLRLVLPQQTFLVGELSIPDLVIPELSLSALPPAPTLLGVNAPTPTLEARAALSADGAAARLAQTLAAPSVEAQGISAWSSLAITDERLPEALSLSPPRGFSPESAPLPLPRPPGIAASLHALTVEGGGGGQISPRPLDRGPIISVHNEIITSSGARGVPLDGSMEDILTNSIINPSTGVVVDGTTNRAINVRSNPAVRLGDGGRASGGLIASSTITPKGWAAQPTDDTHIRSDGWSEQQTSGGWIGGNQNHPPEWANPGIAGNYIPIDPYSGVQAASSRTWGQSGVSIESNRAFEHLDASRVDSFGGANPIGGFGAQNYRGVPGLPTHPSLPSGMGGLGRNLSAAGFN